MDTREHEIEQLETAFWQSMVDGQPQVATDLLTEPALMVSSHGGMRFDHAGYANMTNNPAYRLVSFALSDFSVLFPREDVAIATYRAKQKMQMDGKELEQHVNDTSTWVRIDGDWKCVSHTESEAAPKQ